MQAKVIVKKYVVSSDGGGVRNMLKAIFLTCSHTAADMAFGFVLLQNAVAFAVQVTVYAEQSLVYVLVNGGLADVENFCRAAYGSVVVDDVTGNFQNPFFYVVFHLNPPDYVVEPRDFFSTNI